MRLKLLLSTFALIAVGFSSFAQSPVSCGTVLTPDQEAYLAQNEQAFRNFLNGNSNVRRMNQTMLFPIKHHVIRRSDGTGAVADADVTNQITILNNYYINANIQFYQCGPINYIDNDDWYDFNSTDDEANLTAAHHETDVINVYYAGSVASGGTAVCGYAYFPGGPDVVMMANSCTPNGVTMLHELGHYFALFHTHGTSNFGSTDELVDGSNCSTHGDKLCDTPADPNLTGKVDFNCNYTGTDQDANGDYYTPNTANIMAYSLDQCSNYFSPDQYAKVEFTGLNSRQYLTCASGPCGLSTLDVTNETFWGAGDGSIDLEILGTPPYTYAWDNGDTTEDISGLSPGKYVVTITDGDGCVQLDSAVVGYDGCSPVDVVAFVEVTPNGAAGNLSWEIRDAATQDVIASRTEFGSEPVIIDTICLPAGQTYHFRAFSNDGVGWSPATYQVTCGGRAIIANNSGLSPSNGTNDGAFALESSETFTPSPCTPNDVAAEFVVQPFSRCDLGSQEQAAVRIKNYSGLPISDFDVTISADGAPAISESITGVNIGFLEEYIHTFTGTVDVSGVGFHTLTASAVTTGDGNTTNSDTTVTIESEPTAISSFPYEINFSSPHGLVQIQGEDDFDWTINDGPTPTNFTGPNADNTSGTVTGKYLYVEASSPNHPQKKAVIQTACVDISSLNSPYLEFYYHMFGAGIGSLEVQVLGNQGWQTIWSKNGNRGNQWNEQDLTLNAFVGQVIKIRFIATTGFDATGDIAIDDIKVFNNVVPLGGTIISTTDPSCAGGNDGTASAQGSDGVPPYSYAWSNGTAGQTITNLTAGNVSVTITDALGQTFTTSTSLSEPTPVVPSILASFDVTCNQGNDGNATAGGFGGTPPYSYEWSDGQTTASASGLSAGDFFVRVIDSKGCSDTAFVTLTQPDTLLASTIDEGHVDCFGDTDGFLKVLAVGGVPPYQYNWASGATGDSIGGLDAGVYTLQVVDANNCTFTMLDTIFEPTALNFNIDTLRHVDCNGGNNGYVDLTPTGGTGPYSFLWGDGTTTSDRSNLTAGSYSVTITDFNGCTKSTTINITEPSLISGTMNSSATSCVGCADGTASVNATGGTPPYFYFWSNNNFGSSISNLSTGYYTVTVSDALGCTFVDSVYVQEPLPMMLTGIANDPLCVGDSSGSASVSVTNGVPPLTYSWSNGGTTGTISNLPQGTYTVTVTDANGSTSTVTVTLQDPNPFFVSVTALSIDYFHTSACEGSAFAGIGGGGVSPFTFLWSPGGQTGNQANDLCAGTYTVVVTDANGCEETGTVTIGSNVGIEERNDFGASLYPNPVNNQFVVDFGNALTEDIEMILINAIGEQVLVKSYKAGTQVIEVDASKFAEGLYQVWINSDSRTQVLPVMKQ